MKAAVRVAVPVLLAALMLVLPWPRPAAHAGLAGEGWAGAAGRSAVLLPGELARSSVPARQGEDDLPWAPPEPGYRVQVRQQGIYKLTYADLAAAGVEVDGLDPTTLQLFSAGAEVPIWVQGEEDNTLDPEDYLLFYGVAVESKYTWYNVYWLTYGHAAGKRMQVRDATPSGGLIPDYHVSLLHLEERYFYASEVPGSEDLDRFLWGYAASGGWDFVYDFSLDSPFTGAGGMVRVSLYGYASAPWTRTLVYLNGQLLGDLMWRPGAWNLTELPVAAGLLQPGSNTLRLACPDSGDTVYVDWAEVQFANTFTAVDDVLAFSYDLPGRWQYQVSGFSVDEITLFDVTDPSAVSLISGAVVAPSGAGFSLTFEDQVVASTSYWAGAAGAYLAVNSITEDNPSDLRSELNGADYIVITHADFAQAIAPLAAYRASTGLRVLVADVQDVYDEFGYGVVGAHPIHDFLDFAFYHWQGLRPAYVLLVGDGHYDPKNYLGYGRVSYIPPYLVPVDPWIGETSADNRYVTLEGDDTFPDLSIGRLPVNSAAEAAVVVAKTLQYEQSPAPGDWKTKVLFVADDQDAGGDFDGLSEALIACCLPPSYSADKVYYLITHPSPTQVRQAIASAINQGRFLVNYIGHGATSTWGAEYLFRATDVGSLTNATMQPVVLSMTCKDGYFIEPYVGAGNSMAESLVRADGKGAVAAWSPTGLGVSTGHDLLNSGFFDGLFSGAATTVGEATLAGKQRLWDKRLALDLLDTYHLFGDPALRLAVAPTGVTLSLLDVAPGEGRSLVVQWETVSEIDNVGFNVYRSESAGGPRTKLNSALIFSQVPPGSPAGAFYEFADDTVAPGIEYDYWLEDVDRFGVSSLHGPARGTFAQLFLPVMRR